jgi:hypothetical protein
MFCIVKYSKKKIVSLILSHIKECVLQLLVTAIDGGGERTCTGDGQFDAFMNALGKIYKK